jgi:hypothetical protein
MKKIDFDTKRKELFKKRNAIARANEKNRQEKMKSKSAFLERNNLKKEENKKAFKMKDSLTKLNFEQKKIQFKSNKVLFSKTNEDINRIIYDLNGYQLVSDPEKLSFSLDNNELIVNGVKQPAEIHQKLKGKYIQKPGDRFNYSKTGKTTSITINRD